MTLSKLQAWWFHRQGLDSVAPPKLGGIADTLERHGWARSVGGSSPYLGIFARLRVRRSAIDSAIARRSIHELPAARNCTYIVPATDYGLALRVGAPFSGDELKVARKLGVEDNEISKLGVAIMGALTGGPLDPEGLKQVLGPEVRNLGEEGRKKGLASTLPVTLGRLQSQGQIRRIPSNGRLDQQRYRYELWDPSPFESNPPAVEEEVFVTLARRYFEWIAPATLAEFQWFSGLTMKAAKAAVHPLNLVTLEDERLILPALEEEFAAFQPPAEPRYALVGSIDGILGLRRNVKTLLAANDLDALVQTDQTRVPVGSLADLPSHAILDRGRIIGLWEYDPGTESIAWALLQKGKKPDADLRKTLKEMEEFVRTDLGDARSFSLDSPKSRAPRISALRATM